MTCLRQNNIRAFFPHREREAGPLIYPFPSRKWFQGQKLYIRGHKTNLARVLSGAVGKSLPIPGTGFCSGLTSPIDSLVCCGEALHNWWIWVILMKLLHYRMLCLSLLQPGSILEIVPLFPSNITAKCYAARKRGSHSRLWLNARDSEDESGLGSETLQSEEKGRILRWGKKETRMFSL